MEIGKRKLFKLQKLPSLQVRTSLMLSFPQEQLPSSVFWVLGFVKSHYDLMHTAVVIRLSCCMLINPLDNTSMCLSFHAQACFPLQSEWSFWKNFVFFFPTPTWMHCATIAHTPTLVGERNCLWLTVRKQSCHSRVAALQGCTA